MPRLAELLPPALLRWRSAILRRHGMFGDYATWTEATRHADGYGAAPVLARVRTSLAQVRDGKAEFERDGVLFDRVQHSYPLLAGLLYAAAARGGALDVLDFGGSLGSSYFQCRRFLRPLARVRWNIIEQPSFVAAGRAEFETSELRFYPDVESCFAEQAPTVLLLLSVLQFLPDPAALVGKLLAHSFDVVVVDRTPMWRAPTRITVQHVPSEIYGVPVKYPARIFNRDELASWFPGFELAGEHESDDGPIWSGGHTGWHGGFVFLRREAA
jgi:putative methyltransferase (TIGR04325 family)